MQLDAKGPAGLANLRIPQMLSNMQNRQIDVSAMAPRAMFAGHAVMDAETFGVAVTRRQDAEMSNLTPTEQSRLLDVLVHARAVQHQCDDEGREFPLWLVSSDTRDNRARAVWMTMRKVDQGAYTITLSDA